MEICLLNLGLDLLSAMSGRDKVIIVDATKAGNAPATMYRFTTADIGSSSISLHQLDLQETLGMAKLLGCEPRQVIIFGVEPKNLDWGLDLSPEVASVVPKAIELVWQEARTQAKA